MLNIITSILTAAIRSGTPILLAAQGEILAEKSGVMNIGLEGVMLIGAISGFMASSISGSPYIGMLFAIIAGALICLIHAVLCVNLRVNQIISGLAMFFIGTGLSSVLGQDMVGQSAPGFTAIDMGALSELPVVGSVLFSHDITVYATMVISVAMHFFLKKTVPGLAIRAAGDNPQAVDAAGLSVTKIRIACVLCGGGLSGMAGAYMSLSYTTMWQPAMTGGLGWIAVALVIFSKWNPLYAIIGAYLFGGITALQLALQIGGVQVSAHILQMVPYIFTILVLSVSMWHTRRKGSANSASVSPNALAKPYSREG